MNTFILSVPFIIDIGGAIKDFFSDLVETYIFSVFYYIEIALLYVLKLLESLMLIFTGEYPVVYNGDENSLINVFFSNDSVRGVYVGIGMVGIVFAFAFAIISVIRKMFDSRGKYQSLTMGAILGNLLKSILIIVGMNAILQVSIYSTNILMQAIGDSFTLSKELVDGTGNPIEFTDEQYAAMGRILNTIGNYSLNPSYRSRYNLNACYNDIRTDLKYLGDSGVFKYHYETKDEKDNEIVTWQSLMEELGTAYDYNKETTLDDYDDGITNAILDCMGIIKQNPNIKVLKTYQGTTHEYVGRITLDRIMFLVGTMGTINTAAARNDAYNKNPNFYDNIRAPFYYGSKDMYSFSDVREVFSVSPLKMNYILVYVGSYQIAMEMMVVILTCGVRIFNLLALYLIAPLAIATMPMDDGAKFKQWTTAFIVQLLGVVGMVVAIRLFMLVLPIIWSPSLSVGNTEISLTDVDLSSSEAALNLLNKLLNLLLTMILKIVLTYTAVQAINKVNGIFTGILADNAGMQAITAGDMRQAFGETGIGKMMNSYTPFSSSEKTQRKKEAEAEKKQKKAEKKAEKKAGGGGMGGGGTSGGGHSGKGGDPKSAKKAEKALAKHNKNIKMLDNAIKHGEETGRRMDGKKLSNDGKDLAVMKGTLAHMKNDGMNMKDAKAAALNDYKQQKKQQDAAAAFHKKELKAGPPNREKAQNKAAKMQDHDYKAMKRDLAFMAENGYHANGDEIKPGERGQMEETLKAYEDMHSGDGGDAGKTPEKQNDQVAGDKGGGDEGKTPEKQNDQVAGDKGGDAGKTPEKQNDQVGGNKGSTGSIPDNQSSQIGGGSTSSSGYRMSPEEQKENEEWQQFMKDAFGDVDDGSSTFDRNAWAEQYRQSIPGYGNQSNQVSGSGTVNSNSGSVHDSQTSQVSGSGTANRDVGSVPNSQSKQVGGNEDIPDNIDTSHSIND